MNQSLRPMAARIASLVEDSGLSAEEFAEQAAVTRLPEILTGVRGPSSLDVALVAEFTGRDPLWIIDGKWPLDRLAEVADLVGGPAGDCQAVGARRVLDWLSPFLPSSVVAQAWSND